MAQLRSYSFERVTDANGVPISGAKAYVYDAGTSNLSTIYTTAAAGTTAANPIISDSAGLFPNRYLADATYDIQYKDASDVSLGVLREDIVIATSAGGGGGGGLVYVTMVKTANYTVTADDVDGQIPVLLVDASGIPGLEAVITIDAGTLGVNAVVEVINTGATGTIRVQPDTGAGETIDGATDITLTGAGRGQGFICVGAAGWRTISTTAIQQNALVVTATPATDQTNFTAASLSNAISYKQIELAPTACINFNSVAGITAGERLTITNTLDGTAAAARMIIIPHEHAASTAANRFSFADKMPRFLLPGESLSFIKSGSRLRLDSKSKLSDHFDAWSDCDNLGPYGEDASGSGSTVTTSSVYLASDATQLPRGVFALRVSVTATGGAVLGSTGANANAVTPTKGQALFFTRLAVNALSTASEEFSVRAGFHDAIATATDVTDGIYWEYLRTAATQWSMNCSGASSRSKTASAVTVDTNYVYLGIYINGDWSRADFFISQDGRTYTWAGNQTGANMPTVTEIVGVRIAMKKSAGTAVVNECEVDIMAHRYDTYRGA